MPPKPAIPDFEDLPGAELITQGLADLTSGREGIGALLIEIARSRLVKGGLSVPPVPLQKVAAELRLYELLGKQHGVEAHSQYNAYLRRLGSFCRSFETRQKSTDSAAPP